jgi:GT2 family glycosyltransferase
VGGQKMKLHILTLNWNGENHLEKLGPGLFKNMNRLFLNDIQPIWHVRDNGSKDNSISVIKKFEGIVYSVGHNNDSFAEGMNYLFDKTNASDNDLILFLNNDVIFPEEDSLLVMIDALLKKNVGMVGARLLYNNTNLLQHAGIIFSNKYGKLPYHYRHKEKSDSDAEKNREFQAVTAACAMVRATDWKAVNGMDTGYWWCFEDVDFCLKIGKQLNKKIIYCGGVKIYHEESASLKKNPVNKMLMPQNVNRFKEKWWNSYEIDHENYLKNNKYKLQ